MQVDLGFMHDHEINGNVELEYGKI